MASPPTYSVGGNSSVAPTQEAEAAVAVPGLAVEGLVDSPSSGAAGGHQDGAAGAADNLDPSNVVCEGDAFIVTDAAAAGRALKALQPNPAAGFAAGSNPVAAGSKSSNPATGSNPTTPKKPLSAFLQKLREIVDKSGVLCAWGANGDSLVVTDSIKFSNETLPLHFRTNNFASFLHSYGFRDCKTDLGKNAREFSHAYFLKDKPELMSQIQRKNSNSGSNGGSIGGSIDESAESKAQSESMDGSRNPTTRSPLFAHDYPPPIAPMMSFLPTTSSTSVFPSSSTTLSAASSAAGVEEHERRGQQQERGSSNNLSSRDGLASQGHTSRGFSRRHCGASACTAHLINCMCHPFIGPPGIADGQPASMPTHREEGDSAPEDATTRGGEQTVRRNAFLLGFDNDEHEEALAADGFRWRSGLFLGNIVIFFFLSLIAQIVLGLSLGRDAKLAATTNYTDYQMRTWPSRSPSWYQTVIWGVATVATGAALGLDQHCRRYLRRTTMATILSSIAHMLIVSTVCSQMFSATLISQNISVVAQLERNQVALRNLYIYPILVAVFMPTSRSGRALSMIMHAVYTFLFVLNATMISPLFSTRTLAQSAMDYLAFLGVIVIGNYIARLAAFKNKLETRSLTKRLKSALEHETQNANAQRWRGDRETKNADTLRVNVEHKTRLAEELRAAVEYKTRELRATTDDLRKNAELLTCTANKLEIALGDAEKRAYRAAHDFGTPLAALVLLCEVLKIKYEDDPVVKNLVAGVSSLVRLRELMMDESRVTVGETLQPRRETVNPQELLEEIGRISASTARAAGIEFNLVVLMMMAASSSTSTTRTMAGEEDVDEVAKELYVDFEHMEEIKLLPILADANRMVNVAINFVSNAVKHAKGRVEMVIPVPNDERGFRIEVHDDGGGVPAEIASALFSMTRRAILQTHDGGNGVGLWSVKKMCECVGGNCGFGKSLRLGGSMFWFFVPYVPDTLAAHAIEIGQHDEGGDAKSVATMPMMNILVIDDSFTIRASIKAMLESRCYNVTLAENGRDGLDAMTSRRWRMVLSDVQMPMKDGFEMTRLLREWEATNRPEWHQPVVLMSANVDDKDLPMVSKVGADAFMQKPFGPTKLLEMIEEYAVHIPLNILLIDDSLAFRLSIKSILQSQCGHTVAVAESGRDGLDAMKAEPFDMVLSDVQMPLLDGFKMTQELRAWEDANRPDWRQPLVLMSGNNTQEERTMVTTVGADGFVLKPMSLDVLTATIEQHAVQVQKA